MFVAISCMLGVLHRCVAFKTDRVSGIGDARVLSVGAFNVRNSHRLVCESDVGIGCRCEQLPMAAGDENGSWGELSLQ